MKNCLKCGRSYFREPHSCSGRPVTPGGYPYYYEKLPGMNINQARRWALAEMIKRGELEVITASSYRLGIVNTRYVRN